MCASKFATAEIENEQASKHSLRVPFILLLIVVVPILNS